MIMAKGIIYVMTCTQGLLKIGKTETSQFENRMRRLEDNGYKNFNGFKRQFAVEVSGYDEKEKLVHRLFDKSQVKIAGKGIEMFAVELPLVIDLLKAFDGRQIYPADNQDGIHSEKQKRKQIAKPLTFEMLELPVGSVLTYADDESVSVTTADEKNHVLYGGNTYAMSTLVSMLKGGGSYQGSFYMKYNGRRLTDIRAEKGV